MFENLRDIFNRLRQSVVGSRGHHDRCMCSSIYYGFSITRSSLALILGVLVCVRSGYSAWALWCRAFVAGVACVCQAGLVDLESHI